MAVMALKGAGMDEKGSLKRLFRSDFITAAKRRAAQSSGERETGR